MELSPRFTQMLASGNIEMLPPGQVMDAIDETNVEGNEPATAAAHEFYRDLMASSDFGATDVLMASNDRRVGNARKRMAEVLRVSDDQVREAINARDAGAPAAFDAMEFQYYTR